MPAIIPVPALLSLVNGIKKGFALNIFLASSTSIKPDLTWYSNKSCVNFVYLSNPVKKSPLLTKSSLLALISRW